jgi:hypothetical protein
MIDRKLEVSRIRDAIESIEVEVMRAMLSIRQLKDTMKKCLESQLLQTGEKIEIEAALARGISGYSALHLLGLIASARRISKEITSRERGEKK